MAVSIHKFKAIVDTFAQFYNAYFFPLPNTTAVTETDGYFATITSGSCKGWTKFCAQFKIKFNCILILAINVNQVSRATVIHVSRELNITSRPHLLPFKTDFEQGVKLKCQNSSDPARCICLRLYQTALCIFYSLKVAWKTIPFKLFIICKTNVKELGTYLLLHYTRSLVQ